MQPLVRTGGGRPDDPHPPGKRLRPGQGKPPVPLPRDEGNEFRLEAATQSVIGACMGLLIWWLDDDQVAFSAEEIHSIFRGAAYAGRQTLRRHNLRSERLSRQEIRALLRTCPDAANTAVTENRADFRRCHGSGSHETAEVPAGADADGSCPGPRGPYVVSHLTILAEPP